MTNARFFTGCSLIALMVGCSEKADPGGRGDGTGGGSGGGGIGIGGLGSGGGGIVVTPPGTAPGQPPPRTCEVCEDFPAGPIFVDGAPENAPTLFGDPSNVNTSGGPCIAEPADGTLFPWNWLRPRIRWVGSSDVYEVRLKTARQKNELVVYTTKTEYYIPREVWAGDMEMKSQGLARNNYEEDIVVTVRGVGAGGGTPVGSTVTFQTAANDAAGSMVYWANVKAQGTEAEGDASGWLMGFSVGDEAVIEALRVRDVVTPTRTYAAEPKAVACIGCHTSTPDGNAVSFTGFWPWNGAIAGITTETRGKLPSTVTPSGLAALQQQWLGAWSYSPGQWKDNFKIAVASYGPSTLGWPDGDHNKSNRDSLLWMNIAASEPAMVPTQAWELRQTWTPLAQGKALGILPRQGDNNAALMPDFSNQGGVVAYTSSSTSLDGRIGAINDTNIYTVPFSDGLGGQATPLPGASATGVAEYYPNYSADDAFVAFNRIDNVMGIMKANGVGFENHLYYRPESEIWIAPTSDATAAEGEVSVNGAIRLKANDPNVCSAKKSPGVLNSWGKFSPRVNEIGRKKYYWLIFSSTRDTPDSQRPAMKPPDMYKPIEDLYSRLFMAAFTVEDGKVTTYPAIYLWNQDESSNNLTPAWDEFKIPDVPPPTIPR